MPNPFYTVKLRRATAARWTARNPLLLEGEPGYEVDTKRLKIGDGSSRWNALPYLEVEAEDSNLGEHILAAEPHPAYDDAPSLLLLYENAKV